MKHLFTMYLLAASLLFTGCSIFCAVDSAEKSDDDSEQETAETYDPELDECDETVSTLDSTQMKVIDRICEFYEQYHAFDAGSIDKMLGEVRKIAADYGRKDSYYAALDSLCELTSCDYDWESNEMMYKRRCLSFLRSALIYDNIQQDKNTRLRHALGWLKNEYVTWNKLSEDFASLMVKCVILEFWGGTMGRTVQCYDLTEMQHLRLDDIQMLQLRLQRSLGSYSAGLPTEVAVHAFVESMDVRIRFVKDLNKYLTDDNDRQLTAMYHHQIDSLRPIIETEVNDWIKARKQISAWVDSDQYRLYIEKTSVLLYDMAVLNHDIYRTELE